jgi:hypothetical protein
MTTTVHVAGPVQLGGHYQECARCGHVLQDYTGSEVMVPEGQADLGLPSWPEGLPIAVEGGATWVKGADVPLAEHETECRPAS